MPNVKQQDNHRYPSGKDFELIANETALASAIRLTFSANNLESISIHGSIKAIIMNELNKSRENGISLLEKYGVQDFETFGITSPENQKNVLYALNDLFSNHLQEIKQAYANDKNNKSHSEIETFNQGLDEIQGILVEKSQAMLRMDIIQKVQQSLEKNNPLNLEAYGEASLIAMQAYLNENETQIMQKAQEALPQNKEFQNLNKKIAENAVNELSNKLNAKLTALADQRATAERIAKASAQTSQPLAPTVAVADIVEQTTSAQKSIDLATYEDMAMMASIVIPLSRNPACQTRIQTINQIAAVNGDHSYKALLLAGILVDINQQSGANPNEKAKIEKCLQEYFDVNGIDRAQALKEHQTYSRAIEKANALADKPTEPAPDIHKPTANVSQMQAHESVATTSEAKPAKVSKDVSTSSKFGGNDVVTYAELREGIRQMLKAHKSDHMLGGLFMSSKKRNSIARLQKAIDACDALMMVSNRSDEYDVKSRIDIRDKLIETLAIEAEKFSSTRFNSSEESAYKSRIKNLLDDKIGSGGYEKARKEYCNPAVAQGETVVAVKPEQHGPNGN